MRINHVVYGIKFCLETFVSQQINQIMADIDKDGSCANDFNGIKRSFRFVSSMVKKDMV